MNALAAQVYQCRANGRSEAEIAAALGITKQAVSQRFGSSRSLAVVEG